MEKNEEGISMPIGTIFSAIWKEAPANCVSLNGATYNRATYPDFYDMCVVGKLMTVSMGEYNVQLSSNNSSCGFIGLDTFAQTFRVPTLQNKVFIANGTEVGTYGKDGLPNIIGDTTGYNSRGYISSTSGAFTGINYNDSCSSTGQGSAYHLSFDASRSNVIYGSSDRVQPRHIQYPYFIVVSK